MKHRKSTEQIQIRLAGLILALLLITCIPSVQSVTASAAADTDQKKLIVEVVEEIPAMEIEEEEVPLAAIPEEHAQGHDLDVTLLTCLAAGGLLVVYLAHRQSQRRRIRQIVDNYHK